MRKLFFVPALMLGIVIAFTACQKEQMKTSQNNAVTQGHESLDDAQIVDIDMESYHAMVAANNARLQALGMDASRDCMESVTVPDDYATIQEAVDNVCDYGDVIVKAGTYDESVTVYKPGLHLKANGAVTLNGQFFLTEDADDVKIHKFHIDMDAGSVFRGIEAFYADGGEAYQNTVTGSTGTGIFYAGCNNVMIKQNDVSGTQWGIFLGNNGGEGISNNNNTVSGNTVTGCTFASVIGLQGECDNNLISGNTVTDNPITGNAGIMLYSYFNSGYNCDNNVIKNNVVTGTGNPGIWLYGGSDNTIGPNNTSNENTFYGIYLNADATGNHVFNNTALNTVEQDGFVCDIADLSTGENTEKNNTADCIDGF